MFCCFNFSAARVKAELAQDVEYVLDCDRSQCGNCSKQFSLWTRRSHCRKCGEIYCRSCCTVSNEGVKTCLKCGDEPVPREGNRNCGPSYLRGTRASRARQRPRLGFVANTTRRRVGKEHPPTKTSQMRQDFILKSYPRGDL